MRTIIEAKSITKKFFNPTSIDILNDVSLTVNGGESIAIMGRSGEGKSTLLQILGTLEPATSGELIISGKKVSSYNTASIRRNHIAFVFQSYHLLEDYSVLDNILMAARIDRRPTYKGSKSYQRANELLELVGLSSRRDFDTKLLSGGEKQRVSIARALCNDPDLILADEPSGNLDKETALIIHDLLISFAKNQNKALILVTHNDSLANLCDKKYELKNHALHLQTSI